MGKKVGSQAIGCSLGQGLGLLAPLHREGAGGEVRARQGARWKGVKPADTWGREASLPSGPAALSAFSPPSPFPPLPSPISPQTASPPGPLPPLLLTSPSPPSPAPGLLSSLLRATSSRLPASHPLSPSSPPPSAWIPPPHPPPSPSPLPPPSLPLASLPTFPSWREGAPSPVHPLPAAGWAPALAGAAILQDAGEGARAPRNNAFFMKRPRPRLEVAH